jgi:hypothetical protein
VQGYADSRGQLEQRGEQRAERRGEERRGERRRDKRARATAAVLPSAEYRRLRGGEPLLQIRVRSWAQSRRTESNKDKAEDSRQQTTEEGRRMEGKFGQK